MFLQILKNKWFVYFIIITGTLLVFLSSLDESPTFDEIPYIAAGYSNLLTGNMRVNVEHPPLVKDLAALPLLFMDINPGSLDDPAVVGRDGYLWEQAVLGMELLYTSGNDAGAIVKIARLPMLLFFILSAALIYVWTAEIYGSVAAAVALIIFVFSPTIVSHSRYVTTDVPALTGILYSTYLFLKYLKNPVRKNLILAVIALGLALITKYSTAILIPFFFAVSGLYGYLFEQDGVRGKMRAALSGLFRALKITIFAFVFVVFPVYLLHTLGTVPVQQVRDARILLYRVSQETSYVNIVFWLAGIWPMNAIALYLTGLVFVTWYAGADKAFDIFLAGKTVPTGIWWYFPFVFLIKEPLAWISGIMLAVGLTLHPAVNLLKKGIAAIEVHVRKNFGTAMMLSFTVIYWSLSLMGGLNIGIRHLIPVYGFMIMLVAGRLTGWYEGLRGNVRRIAGYGLCLLLVWYLGTGLSAFPAYLSYFNELTLLRPPWIASGHTGYVPGGHNFVADSNLDWGQDLIRLNRWLDRKGIRKIEYINLTSIDASYYLGAKFIASPKNGYSNRTDFLSRNKSDGWLAVHATQLLQMDPTKYTWLREIRPATTINGSIFIWHLTD